MKIQFCSERFDPRFHDDVIAEFEIVKEPAEWQCIAIEKAIFKAIDEWYEENDGDFSEFDYWGVCFEVTKKYLKIVDNPVVKTFYL
jgi:hypothetical protein